METADDGIELLTGGPAGARGADGAFPEGSVHRRVEDHLRGYADLPRDFAASPDGGTAVAAPHRAYRAPPPMNDERPRFAGP